MMIIQSSLAKWWMLGRCGTSARAGHNPGHGQILQAVIGNSGFGTEKKTGFCGQHRGFARFHYCLIPLSSREAASFCFSLLFFWQVLRQKRPQDVTSYLNEFFKNCQNFVGHRMPFHNFQFAFHHFYFQVGGKQAVSIIYPALS